MSLLSDVGGFLGATAVLWVGIGSAVKGTRAAKLKRKADEARAESESSERKEARLDTLTSAEMERLGGEVTRLRGEVDRERADRIAQANEFFAIIASFRSRDWRWSELYHELVGVMRENGLSELVVPMPADLRVLPNVDAFTTPIRQKEAPGDG